MQVHELIVALETCDPIAEVMVIDDERGEVGTTDSITSDIQRTPDGEVKWVKIHTMMSDPE